MSSELTMLVALSSAAKQHPHLDEVSVCKLLVHEPSPLLVMLPFGMTCGDVVDHKKFCYHTQSKTKIAWSLYEYRLQPVD